MPHGTPDWGLVGPKETLYGLDDLGEHAARLGSIHLWDRRGDTVLLDSFEAGLAQCMPYTSGLLAAVTLMGGEALQGAFCAKLTTGSDDEWRASLFYRHGRCVTSMVGIEFSFTIPEVVPLPEPTTAYWTWEVRWYTGTRLYMATVRYDLRAWTLEYRNAGGGFTPFADGLPNRRNTTCWHTGKMVVNLDRLRYVRFILNDQEWDLSDLFEDTPELVILPEMSWQISLLGQNGENQSGYADAVVITQNEP